MCRVRGPGLACSRRAGRGRRCDILTTALVMEALGYGCHDNGLLFSLNAQMWSVELPLVMFGAARRGSTRYLPGMVSGGS